MKVRLIVEYEYCGDETRADAAAREEVAAWLKGDVAISDIVVACGSDAGTRMSLLACGGGDEHLVIVDCPAEAAKMNAAIEAKQEGV